MNNNKEKKKRVIPLWPTILIAVCINWIWQWFKYSTAENNALMWIGIFSIVLAFLFGHLDGREDTKNELEAKYSDMMLQNHLLDIENKTLKEKIRELSK